ncbi:MAG: WD40 repeat domain-containing protein [Fluviicola sp.]
MFRKEREISGHAGAIYSCTFDGTYIYSGSADKFVARWIPEEGIQDKFAIKFEHSIYALEHYESFLLVGRSDGGFHVFNTDSRTEEKYFTQHTKAIFTIQINPVKGHCYVADADGNVSVWDVNEWELLLYLPLDCGKIREIAVAQDGSRIAICGQDGNIRIFDTDTFNEIFTINAHKNGATAASFDGASNDLLISGGKDAMLRLWDLPSGACLKEIPAHNFAIYKIMQVGEAIVSVSRDKTVKIFSKDFQFIKRLDHKEGGHKHSVNDAVPLDDYRFVTCGDDSRMIIWTSKVID